MRLATYTDSLRDRSDLRVGGACATWRSGLYSGSDLKYRLGDRSNEQYAARCHSSWRGCAGSPEPALSRSTIGPRSRLFTRS